MIFIYALINPLTNNVFYVGATINKVVRLKQHLTTKFHNGYRADQIRRILVAGKDVEMLILCECEKKDAKNEEQFYISLFKFYGYRLEQIDKSNYPCETIEMSDAEIVQCLADGLKTKQIANRANVGIRVIEKRLELLKNKHQAKNSVHLMSIYFRKQLIA